MSNINVSAVAQVAAREGGWEIQVEVLTGGGHAAIGPWGSVHPADRNWTSQEAQSWAEAALIRFAARVRLYSKGLIAADQV